MANDYNELEQLVNDVTNIDTARMTLRWALERLNSIEKEKAGLKKDLTIAEEAGKGLEAKVKSLQESFESRGKVLDEKEDFYSKLDATMALLGDGKLDIGQLLKKEAKLDQIRKDLDNEYQGKFEELDRSQGALIDRWNRRLLGVEEQYAKRLAEAQSKYDALRGELEAGYQGRLSALEKTYQGKEKELLERLRLLETSVKSGENGLEGRRKELEAEFLAKKTELEENYLKLKAMLETGFDERARFVEEETNSRTRSLENTWTAERSRLLEEMRIRDGHFKKAQEEMASLQAGYEADLKAARGEISGLALKNRQLNEQLLDKTAAFNREMVEIKAGYEKELNLRVKDTVELQTARLLEALEAAKKRNEEMSGLVNVKSAEIDRLKAEKDEQARRFEEEMAAAGSRAVSERIAELRNSLEKEYQARHAELDKNHEILGRQAAEEKEALKNLVMSMRKEVYEVNMKAESFFSEMMEGKRAQQEEIRKLNEEHLAEMNRRTGEAVAKASEALTEKLCFAEAEMLKLQNDHVDDVRVMQDSFHKERERLLEELERRERAIDAGDMKMAQLESEITALREEAALETQNRLAAQEEKFKALMSENHARRDEQEKEAGQRLEATRKMYEARLKDAEERASENLVRATDALAEKLAFAEGAMMKLQKDGMDEARAMQDVFQKEKDRMLDEMDRRERAIEAGDVKIAQLDGEITALREGAAADLHARLAEQEEKFKTLLREDQERHDRLQKEAAETFTNKMFAAEAAMMKIQKDNQDEIRVMQDVFQKEKERVLEELERRERIIETGDGKIAQLENEIMRYRGDSSAVVFERLSEQEAKFSALLRENDARRHKIEKESSDRLEEIKKAHETRIGEMEDMLRAKETLMRENEEMFRRRQLDLDARYSELNAARGSLEESALAQEKAFAEKEKKLHGRNLELEREYSAGRAEIDRLRIELTRVIMEYKSRK